MEKHRIAEGLRRTSAIRLPGLAGTLQRSQEVQDILLVGSAQRIERGNDTIGFRAAILSLNEGLEVGNAAIDTELLEVRRRDTNITGAGVGLDRLQQVGSPAVMQEEYALAHTP